MNLDNITTQPFILSLFKREDGVRFLLGSGAYEFKNSQLHFAANAFLNDVVEIQGNDGALLAGQVRRASVQAFDGYVGDGTTIKSKIEQYRTNFLKFFQKNHFYTVIYIFPDGTAIQRRRGYIVDAPQVKELYQQYPEYHIAFNFEDVNYYKYSENAEGEETYSNLANILSSVSVSGGLIWTQGSSGTETRTATGTDLVLADSTDDGFDDVDMLGATSQTTYSGKNLLNIPTTGSITSNDVTTTYSSDGTMNVSGTVNATWCNIKNWGYLAQQYPAGTYKFSVYTDSSYQVQLTIYEGSTPHIFVATKYSPVTITTTYAFSAYYVGLAGLTSGSSIDATIRVQLEAGSSSTSWEPYVGGTASPNPSYPQKVQTVTGEQTITISDGGGNTQTKTVNLGKNLLPIATSTSGSGITFTVGSDGKVTVSGTASATKTLEWTGVSLSAGTYTLSGCPAGGSDSGYRMDGVFTSGGSGFVGYDYGNGLTFTLTSNATITFRIRVASGAVISTPIVFEPMLEIGSIKTTYATYFTPIELCKIGTYQDYIYKSGNDWYVHKEIGTTTDIIGSNSKTISDMVADSSVYSYCGGTVSGTTITYSKALVVENIIYYPLTTPTDTQITDATLISELEALLGANTYNGQTLVSVSGDLKSPLTITYTASIMSNGGIEWDNYGAVWEEGGGGGQAIITVDSITNVLPTIKITGPASNPVLTNITTGQSIRYYGYVLDSQTLVIDVNQKTAKLNGTSVIQNVDGDWLELAPGNNRMEYTVDNADQVSAIIEWQEIVG